MNPFKRIGMFVFGIAGIICLVTLSLPWFGPWTRGATALMTVRWYNIMVRVAIGITALGVLVMLARSILTPRKSKTVVVTKSSGDEITITTAAISSQVAHIVEEDHEFFAEKVMVYAKRRGHVRVRVRVRPAHAINVTEEGAILHQRLEEGLATMCGKSVDRIVIEFVEPDSLDPKPEFLGVLDTHHESYSEPYGESSAIEPFAPADDHPVEITVPMSTPVEAPAAKED